MESYADAWKRWFPIIERGAEPLNRLMLERAEISGADRVLDVGTGIGEPALTVARALEEGGEVVAIDHDPAMIEFARARADECGAENIGFDVLSAEDLRFEPSSFDVAFARWSLMFVDDFAATLSRLHGILRPGGRLVLAVWGPPECVPAISLAREVVNEHLGLGPPDHGPKTAFALSDTKLLRSDLADAGFHQASGDWVPVVYEFASAEAYIQFRTDCGKPLFPDSLAVDETARRSALEAVTRALDPYHQRSGSVRMVNWAYCVTAQTAKSGSCR